MTKDQQDMVKLIEEFNTRDGYTGQDNAKKLIKLIRDLDKENTRLKQGFENYYQASIHDQ